ncbi:MULTISPECIES: response regulator transcription factor [Nocardioides]|uniref:Response regulator n=1 Tax=Nocardioides kribbensis TaxID=305517 RepID=A0ABV1NWN2_9ACTN|nr:MULTISPECIES: response regulator [Nocardioides]MCM3515640.1 response regulator [Nocardioides sp. P86]
MRILVVDDDPDLSTLMEIFLGRAGHDVELAPDGRCGLRRLLAGGFDAVVLDWMMPTLDGLGLTRAVRSDPALRDLPLLMVTARRDHAAAYAAGVDEVLDKPFSGAGLVSAVETLGRRTPARAGSAS